MVVPGKTNWEDTESEKGRSYFLKKWVEIWEKTEDKRVCVTKGKNNVAGERIAVAVRVDRGGECKTSRGEQERKEKKEWEGKE